MSSLDRAPASVRRASDRDIPDLTSALARAFYDDPLFVWMFPHDGRRLRQTRRHFVQRMRNLIAQEEVYTTESATGAALWARPNEWRDPPVSALRQIASLIPVMGLRLPSVLRALNEVEIRHPSAPHWYLAVLGIAPEHQGNGVAAGLLHPVLERCDRDGTPAYLETAKERNTAFYTRHGFVVTDQIVLPGGPSIWLMWREPAP